MTKKPEKKPAQSKPVDAAKKPKAHATKPSSNPFTQQNPGRPGRSAAGGTPGARRGR